MSFLREFSMLAGRQGGKCNICGNYLVFPEHGKCVGYTPVKKWRFCYPECWKEFQKQVSEIK